MNKPARDLAENKQFWENAINSRHSCRSYQIRPVEEKVMQKLKGFSSSITLPFDHEYELRFFKSTGRPIANNLKRPPPNCLAFMSKTDLLSIAKTGFAGELFILYATGLGINTCWFGHYILPELERAMPHLGNHANDPAPSFGYGKEEVDGVRAICITPLGYWEQKGLRLIDRIASNVLSFKRKPLAKLMDNNVDPDKLPSDIKFALDLASKAPSGGNTQHWRFNFSNDGKTVIIAKPEGYKHFRWEHCEVDVGICASHFWLGLKIQSVPCSLEPILDVDRVLWKFSL
jgi:nitroreductase